MPSGVFKPYAGVSTAIVVFTKTNSGGTDEVWFYDMQADGYSLDDKRTPQPDKSDLKDALARWQNRTDETGGKRPDQSFLVPAEEIAGTFVQEHGRDAVQLLTKWVPAPGPASRDDVRTL